jgi:hypothetical protein
MVRTIGIDHCRIHSLIIQEQIIVIKLGVPTGSKVLLNRGNLQLTIRELRLPPRSQIFLWGNFLCLLWWSRRGSRQNISKFLSSRRKRTSRRELRSAKGVHHLRRALPVNMKRALWFVFGHRFLSRTEKSIVVIIIGIK